MCRFWRGRFVDTWYMNGSQKKWVNQKVYCFNVRPSSREECYLCCGWCLCCCCCSCCCLCLFRFLKINWDCFHNSLQRYYVFCSTLLLLYLTQVHWYHVRLSIHLSIVSLGWAEFSQIFCFSFWQLVSWTAQLKIFSIQPESILDECVSKIKKSVNFICDRR